MFFRRRRWLLLYGQHCALIDGIKREEDGRRRTSGESGWQREEPRERAKTLTNKSRRKLPRVIAWKTLPYTTTSSPSRPLLPPPFHHPRPFHHVRHPSILWDIPATIMADYYAVLGVPKTASKDDSASLFFLPLSSPPRSEFELLLTTVPFAFLNSQESLPQGRLEDPSRSRTTRAEEGCRRFLPSGERCVRDSGRRQEESPLRQARSLASSSNIQLDRLQASPISARVQAIWQQLSAPAALL